MTTAHNRTEPVYMIGVVAGLTQMHAQTIRLYERLGLVVPQRKNKNRLYSESDVERLRQIRRLTQELAILSVERDETKKERERAQEQGG